MCKYLNQTYSHEKCRATPKHTYTHQNWKTCLKGRAQGHFCADAQHERDASGNIIVLGSTRRPGDCPMCPPELPH